jgi:polyhydroxyalkanoate synthase
VVTPELTKGPITEPDVEMIDAVASTDPVAVPTALNVLKSLARTFAPSTVTARESVKIGRELVQIVAGRSTIAPPKNDSRFRDPTWTDNGLYHRIMQGYLALCAGTDNIVANREPDDWRRLEQARFATNLLTSAAAPTNNILGNPAALKKTLETGGRNLLRGAANFVDDIRHNGGMPANVKRDVLRVGEHLALTPGTVINRDDVAEIIRYTPTTDVVRERPLVIIPPPIGRFYFLDLRPGRSLVEYAVSRGLQTHLLSWRNPGPDQADWDLDTYASRVLSAIDTVRETTGSDDVTVIGFCAGGILTSTVLNYLAARGDHRVHAAAFAVTLLDFGVQAPLGAFNSAPLLGLARQRSGKSGVITAQSLSRVFALMRPNDLIWNSWVNNYLLGQDPALFDILAWNADGTNLPATLHSQFLDIFAGNTLVEPKTTTVLGVPVDLTQITTPTYVVGALNDHLTPWQGCYRTTQLLSGPATFVLSNAGHIASLVNPPGNPKASYLTSDEAPDTDPEAWRDGATQRAGSWWEHWADWAVARSGGERKARTDTSTTHHRELDAAPGRYVRDLTP